MDSLPVDNSTLNSAMMVTQVALFLIVLGVAPFFLCVNGAPLDISETKQQKPQFISIAAFDNNMEQLLPEKGAKDLINVSAFSCEYFNQILPCRL